jgi:hypothetical protein
MGTEVTSHDIGNSYYKIVKFIVVFGSRRLKDGIVFAINIVKFILTWLLYSIQSFPVYLFIGIVVVLMTFFWNETIKPLILLLLEAWNGAIRAWNRVASSLRNMGFEIPLPTGNIGIHFGIPVPDGNEINVDIPDFIPFVTGILVPNLFMPIKKSLNGIIFADETDQSAPESTEDPDEIVLF